MNKETITIEIPVLDTQESFDLVNTFNEEQMKYVAVICKGYEKEVQKANKQKEVLDKIKEYIENTDDFDIEIFDENSGGCLGTDLSKGAKHILELLEEIE